MMSESIAVEQHIQLELGKYQKYMAVIDSFAGHAVSAAEELEAGGVERAEFMTLVSSQSNREKVLLWRHSALNVASGLRNEEFEALFRLFWLVASEGITDRSLTISSMEKDGKPMICIDLYDKAPNVFAYPTDERAAANRIGESKEVRS